MIDTNEMIDEGRQAAEDATRTRKIAEGILEHAEGMRAAGSWLAKHAETLAALGMNDYLASDYMAIGNVDRDSLLIYVYGENQRATLAELVAEIGGKWEKDYSANQFILSQKIAGEFTVRFWADRAKVCEAKVVGTEEVEVTDYEAVRQLPKKKITRDVIEWECAPLIGGGETSIEGKA